MLQCLDICSLLYVLNISVISTTGHTDTTKTSIFNMLENVWMSGPPMLGFRAEHACGQIKDSNGFWTVILAGGYNNAMKQTISSTEYYDIKNNKWISGPQLPYQVGGPLIVPNPAGGILLVGGVNSQSTRTDILSLSSVTLTWTTISRSLITGRYQHVTMPFTYFNITTCTCKFSYIFHDYSFKYFYNTKIKEQQAYFCS
jgi:hypothetical protein